MYGNLNCNSGSGVAFSRSPDGSSSTPVGEYLSRAEGKEVLEGDRTSSSMADLARNKPAIHEELLTYMRKLEERDAAIQYVEFTVENDKLYILETSDVNHRPNTKDSRFVVYYDLLTHLQDKEEQNDVDPSH